MGRMNVILARPTRPALWERYVGLAPGPKLLLRLKSLMIPAPGKVAFAECVTKSGLRSTDGRIWSARSVAAMLDEMAGQGLLTPNLACPPALLHLVAADAAESADAGALAAAIRQSFPGRSETSYYSSYIDQDAIDRLIRLAAYTNDEAEFIANSDFCNKWFGPHGTVIALAKTFYDVPLEAEWIASRHAVI